MKGWHFSLTASRSQLGFLSMPFTIVQVDWNLPLTHDGQMILFQRIFGDYDRETKIVDLANKRRYRTIRKCPMLCCKVLLWHSRILFGCVVLNHILAMEEDIGTTPVCAGVGCILGSDQGGFVCSVSSSCCV
jgi:hypothetical protein